MLESEEVLKMEDLDNLHGLSGEEAEQLRREGKCNRPEKPMTKSYKHILFENIFSVFNLINAVIAAALLYVHSYKNCLFMIAVISNTLIGIVQEVRSKRVTDRLSIVSQRRVTVIRSGQRRSEPTESLVKGDLIELTQGCQLPNDCVVVSGSCEVNESLLTGEADALPKRQGDKLLSGSFLVGGSCVARITAVGSENYSDSILSQIKYVKRTNSEIVRVIKRIISVVTICIVPIGAMLFHNQLTQSGATLREAVESSSAALIGMIPEGLVLLTSTVFALGVVRLARKNVLSQDLYSLEALARTDVICLDKTGTITTGEMKVVRTVAADKEEERRLLEALSVFSALTPDRNSTAQAIRAAFPAKEGAGALSVCPFSGDRKWSSVTPESGGTIVLGSPEMIFGGDCDMSALADGEAELHRVVCVARSEENSAGISLPGGLRLLGFVLLKETLREGVGETLDYFRRCGVSVRIISGDNPKSVQRLCADVLHGRGSCANLARMSDEQLAEAVEDTVIFGRATPRQKKLIVSQLRKNGHTVAMIGDGVNDVLALKESDCSVAPANGSDAARDVAQLVLLDNDFRSLPSVAAEGRRSLNNLQNSASLFLAKTIFSAAMALIFIFLNRSYPFAPIQMTLVSTLTIGFPSFILSFIKNERPISGSFLRHIIANSVPAAAANIVSVMTVVMMSDIFSLSDKQTATLCVTALAVTGVSLLFRIYRPLTGIKLFVFAAAASGFALSFLFFGSFFGLAPIFGRITIYMVIISIIDLAVLSILLFALSPSRKTGSGDPSEILNER